MTISVAEPEAVQSGLTTTGPDLTAVLAKLNGLSAEEMVSTLVRDLFPGQITLVSSFGTEAAILLKMVADADPSTPITFLNTEKLFGETLRYRNTLVDRLGLTDIRELHPDADVVAAEDPDGMLFSRNHDRCCAIRKVEPLARGLSGFGAWINGRKGHHGGGRAAMPVAEQDGPRIKATPLARWTAEDVDGFFERHALPRHPLFEDGFLSVGCMPCTERATGDDIRSGRWAGSGKTECGIHLPFQGADI
ncbi:MAG: phosphoadenylyl-sulfate reductase [Rhodospirillaceae bacterium]